MLELKLRPFPDPIGSFGGHMPSLANTRKPDQQIGIDTNSKAFKAYQSTMETNLSMDEALQLVRHKSANGETPIQTESQTNKDLVGGFAGELKFSTFETTVSGMNAAKNALPLALVDTLFPKEDTNKTGGAQTINFAPVKDENGQVGGYIVIHDRGGNQNKIDNQNDTAALYDADGSKIADIPLDYNCEGEKLQEAAYADGKAMLTFIKQHGQIPNYPPIDNSFEF